MNITRLLGLGTLAVLLSGSFAQAATVTVADPSSAAGNVIFTSTTSPNQSVNHPPVVVDLSVGKLSLVDAAIVDSEFAGNSGNADFTRKRPDGTSGNFLAVFQPKGNGTATLELKKAATSFSFNWGSIDTYNFVTVSNGSGYTRTFTYTDLEAAASAALAGGSITKYVTFSGLPNITKIVFGDTDHNAFEIGSLSITSVPLPGAILLFGSALGGTAFLRRRQSQKA